MSATRRMWIDTDTASDDVVAIVMALKHQNTEVVGMSIVIGNVPVELGVQNALYTAELCGKSVPVHAGAEMPLVRPFATAQHVHGADGMGDIGLPLKGRKATSNNAVHEMIEAFRKEPGELELVALGPLTNLALAIRIEPKFASWVKRCVIMGGTGVLPGNITPLAEFNWWVDPEAVHIVLESGMKVEMVGWDKAGSGMVTCFVKGDVAAVKAAVDAGAEAAGRVGSVISVHVIARPHDELGGMYPKGKKPAAAAPVVKK